MATVEFKSISKSYGSVEVIRDLSLSIADREFTVLLGPSGCGKTTLLRMTAGLETIGGGDLMIGGEKVNDIHPRDRDIAMVFQNYALYPTMKVFDNIAFALEVKKTPKDEIHRRVTEAAETLNLTDYLDRYPKELSGGQRQRVAMGRAMVRKAQVFLFDEPLSNLDAKLRAHMRVEIRQLHNRLGTTTIYVTHDQIEAMTMADRIVLMRDGEIVQSGTPDELFDRPATRYAADFIGSPAINFVDGQITGKAGAAMFEAPDIRLPLPPDCAAQAGRNVTAGLRPSDMVPAEAGVSGTLVLAERTGVEQNLYLSVGGQEFVATSDRDLRLAPGAPVTLALAPAKVHLFDRETGLRI